MKQKFRTKDEYFMVKLHELACEQGSYDHPIDRFIIGQEIGQNDRGVNTIVKHLAQANFIIKEDPSIVFLTPHGLKFVEQFIYII